MPDIPPLRAFCWGVLHAIGMFGMEDLTNEEKLDCAGEKEWFSFGEVVMAALLSAAITIPAGLWFAGRAGLPPAFAAAGLLFLLLFVFLPRLIRSAMKVDTDAVLLAFGRNEQVKKAFWALFTALAGLLLAHVIDPAAAQQVTTILTGIVT